MLRPSPGAVSLPSNLCCPAGVFHTGCWRHREVLCPAGGQNPELRVGFPDWWTAGPRGGIALLYMAPATFKARLQELRVSMKIGMGQWEGKGRPIWGFTAHISGEGGWPMGVALGLAGGNTGLRNCLLWSLSAGTPYRAMVAGVPWTGTGEHLLKKHLFRPTLVRTTFYPGKSL